MSNANPQPSAPLLGGQACLLDSEGAIAWVNEPWRRQGAPLWRNLVEGDSYLTACVDYEAAHPVEGSSFSALLRELLANQRTFFEYELLQGGHRYLVRAQAIAFDTTHCVFLQHEDVTSTRLAEATLHASEERYRQFFEAAPDAVFLLSADGDEAGRILDANTLAAISHGYSRDELLGMKISDLDDPADAARAAERIGVLMRDGFISFNATHVRKDGSEFPVEVTARKAIIGGKPCIVTFNRDITDRQQFEQELRENQLRLSLAARASQIGFWDWDIRRNEVVFSPEWKAQIGYLPDEISNDFSEWESRVHPDDLGGAKQAVEDHLNGKTPVYTTEFRFRHKDGSYRWIFVRGEVMRDDHGNPLRFVGCHVDITERKLAEQEREAMSQRMNQMQRLEAIGTLAGGIAHDFNNILSIISGNAQLALLEAQDESVQEMLTDIRKAGERARSLVRQILTFSRNEIPERSRLTVEPVIDEAACLLRSTMPRTLSVETKIAPDVPEVLADAEQIQQVLVNLGTNAWHAIGDEGGQIDIELTAGKGEIDGTETDCVILTVRDNGAGMNEETRRRVFEPFFTTKPSDKGTGLGLSVVHGIVKSHGGAIEAESTEGVGTAFRIWLPAAATATPAATRQPQPTPKGGGRLLLIDDEPTLLRVLARGLTRYGFEVRDFTDPEDALAVLAASPADYDALITDYDMPNINGTEVAKRVREIREDMPILLCSGFLSDTAAEAATRAGSTCILTKPVLANELAARVTEALAPSVN